MPKSPQAFRTIREVADWLDVAAHVLRFWESKFPQIKPVKRAGGRRYYRPGDMELVGGIKVLLHDQGLTIKGVQNVLQSEGASHVASLSPPLDGLDLPEEEEAETNVAAWDSDARSDRSGIEDAEIVPETPPETAPETEQTDAEGDIEPEELNASAMDVDFGSPDALDDDAPSLSVVTEDSAASGPADAAAAETPPAPSRPMADMLEDLAAIAARASDIAPENRASLGSSLDRLAALMDRMSREDA